MKRFLLSTAAALGVVLSGGSQTAEAHVVYYGAPYGFYAPRGYVYYPPPRYGYYGYRPVYGARPLYYGPGWNRGGVVVRGPNFRFGYRW